MDSQQLEKLWKTVISELEIDLGKTQTTIFFSRSSLVSYEKNIAKIFVPNIGAKDAFERKYYILIKNALERHLKETISFIVEVNKSKLSTTTDSGPLFENENIIQTHTIRRPSPSLNPRYTFENLVVGSANNFAHAAAVRICKNPGKDYNPFFIYGGVGVGKTHLMQAVGHELYLKQPNLRVMYTTAENFMNELVASFKDKSTQNFKRKYREADLLLVDDIQFMSGKESMQEEFFHCFNALYMAEKQVILTSDRPPEEIRVEDRLLSRLMGGLAVDIQPPDLEMRMAIVKQKLEMRNENWTSDVIEYLSIFFQSNVREIEGGIQKILALSLTNDKPVDIDLARQALGQPLQKKNPEQSSYISPKKVIAAAAKVYQVKLEEMLSPSREAHLVLPRQVAMYLLRHDGGMDFMDVAFALNRKDHTTVIHAVKKMENLYSHDHKLREKIMLIKKELWGQNS